MQTRFFGLYTYSWAKAEVTRQYKLYNYIPLHKGYRKKLLRLILSRKPENLEQAMNLVETEMKTDEAMKKLDQKSINSPENK